MNKNKYIANIASCINGEVYKKCTVYRKSFESSCYHISLNVWGTVIGNIRDNVSDAHWILSDQISEAISRNQTYDNKSKKDT